MASTAPAASPDFTRRAPAAPSARGHRASDGRSSIDASAAAERAAAATPSTDEPSAARRDAASATPAELASPAPLSPAAHAGAHRASGPGGAASSFSDAPAAPALPAPPPGAQASSQSLHDMAASDPSLHAAAIGKNAHLRLETAGGGDLTMHLRVNDGVADLEVGGSALGALGLRPQELRRALAGEGLTLGQFVTRSADASVDTRAVSDSSGGGSSSQAGQGSGWSSSSTPREPAPAPPSTGAAASHGGSFSFNQGRRQWQGETADGTDLTTARGPSPAGSTAAASPSDPDARIRRRGFHVTA